MPDPTFSVKYTDREVRDGLIRLQQKVGDLTPAMQEVGEYCILATDQRFIQERDVQGRPWIPLSPVTIARKRAEGRITKILQSTGLMRSRTAYTATSDRCIIHNNDKKSARHQLGRGVPKREFLGVSAEDKTEIVAILDDYILS